MAQLLLGMTLACFWSGSAFLYCDNRAARVENFFGILVFGVDAHAHNARRVRHVNVGIKVGGLALRDIWGCGCKRLKAIDCAGGRRGVCARTRSKRVIAWVGDDGYFSKVHTAGGFSDTLLRLYTAMSLLEQNTWLVPLLEWLVTRINNGECTRVAGKRSAVKRAPDSLNPTLLDDHLDKIKHVADLQAIVSEWVAQPHVAATLSPDAKIELPRQVALYKRGSLARIANKRNTGELRELRKRKHDMDTAREQINHYKSKLNLALNIIEHYDVNASLEAEVRGGLRSTRIQQSSAARPLAIPDDFFDDLDSTQGSQEAQSHIESLP